MFREEYLYDTDRSTSIDNPKDYADNVDARQFDPRLRGPVAPIELAIDPNTGMKNYIANDSLGIATSLGYIKWSFARSIHFGRMYTHGPNRGRDEDLCEALRCLGQGLHCMEDFGVSYSRTSFPTDIDYEPIYRRTHKLHGARAPRNGTRQRLPSCRHADFDQPSRQTSLPTCDGNFRWS